jgi:hypothetical protein
VVAVNPIISTYRCLICEPNMWIMVDGDPAVAYARHFRERHRDMGERRRGIFGRWRRG